MKSFIELRNTVINNGYCIGCGACSYASNGLIDIKMNDRGQLQAIFNDNSIEEDNEKILEVCPFYNYQYNEDLIGESLFSRIESINHDKYLGYNLLSLAGYVKNGDYRKNGSSGGFGSWIAAKLLEEGLIDKVIHVKQTNSDSDLLFEYQISNSIEEVHNGSKSRYYPIEMSKVLDYVKNNDYNYLFVGIPCFIKALRQLQIQYPILQKRIKYTLGLVCGHLKSDFFAKSIAWELGINPLNLESIDFRIKNNSDYASNYNIKVNGVVNDQRVEIEAATKSLFVSDWGHGFFKYKACDFCDDVLAETADITIGDAWLPEYNRDVLGTNLIIIRNNEIKNILSKYNNEIEVDMISNDNVYKSQEGGFRHRREGLQYRLHLVDRDGDWRPIKRYFANNNISKKRKKIFKIRIDLVEKSYLAYKKAMIKGNFSILKKELTPLVMKYNKVYQGNRIIYYSKIIFKKIKKYMTPN